MTSLTTFLAEVRERIQRIQREHVLGKPGELIYRSLESGELLSLTCILNNAIAIIERQQRALEESNREFLRINSTPYNTAQECLADIEALLEQLNKSKRE